MDKSEKRILDRLSGANIAFFLCDKLRAEGLHICDSELVNNNGDVLKNCEISLVYCIQKLFYESDYYKPKFDINEVVAKYFYVFQLEMTSKDQLISLLMN